MLSRIFQSLLAAVLATSPLQATIDPFVGQWKLIKLTDQMKVTKIGASRYAFDFGGVAETISIDGTDQPGYAGTTLSVAVEGSSWKVIRKKGSRVLLTAAWTLSQDGNSLDDDFTAFGQDGSPSNIKYVYERRGPGPGFAGTWVSTSAPRNSAIMLQIRMYGSNGLSFIIPAQSQTTNATFDGKDHPSADASSVLSARRLNARVVKITRKTKDKITQTKQIELSRDMKALTMTVHIAGKYQPYIYVFERQ